MQQSTEAAKTAQKSSNRRSQTFHDEIGETNSDGRCQSIRGNQEVRVVGGADVDETLYAGVEQGDDGPSR